MYLIGAIALCCISVYAIKKSHRLYVDERGLVTKALSITYAILSVLAASAAYCAIEAYLSGGS